MKIWQQLFKLVKTLPVVGDMNPTSVDNDNLGDGLRRNYMANLKGKLKKSVSYSKPKVNDGVQLNFNST